MVVMLRHGGEIHDHIEDLKYHQGQTQYEGLKKQCGLCAVQKIPSRFGWNKDDGKHR